MIKLRERLRELSGVRSRGNFSLRGGQRKRNRSRKERKDARPISDVCSSRYSARCLCGEESLPSGNNVARCERGPKRGSAPRLLPEIANWPQDRRCLSTLCSLPPRHVSASPLLFPFASRSLHQIRRIYFLDYRIRAPPSPRPSFPSTPGANFLDVGLLSATQTHPRIEGEEGALAAA